MPNSIAAAVLSAAPRARALDALKLLRIVRDEWRIRAALLDDDGLHSAALVYRACLRDTQDSYELLEQVCREIQ